MEELINAFDKNKSLFDPDRITSEEREKLRSSFVSDFPIDEILEMKLDDYVAGKHDPISNQVDRSTFCYRLERGLSGLGGISGVVAQKFGIYFNHKMNTNNCIIQKYEQGITPQPQIYTIKRGKKHWNSFENADFPKLARV